MNDFHVDKLASAVTLLISVIYVLVISFSTLLPLLHTLRSLFGFVLLTYFLGLSVRIFLRNVAKLSSLPSTISIGGVACDLLFSLLGSFAVGFVLIRAFLLDETFFVALVIALIVILNLSTLYSLRRRKTPSLADTSSQKGSLVRFLAPGIVLVAASILFASFFRSKTPFPTISGWDMNSSLAYINWTIFHKGYHYVLIPPFPSGVTPYPAFFFYLVSYYSLFLGVEPYSLFWFSIYPLILGYMFLVFLIALKFSKNIWLSVMSSFIAFFTSTASAEGARNPLYLTLDMVSQTIFLLIICLNIHYDSHSIEKRIANITATVFLVLFNYYTAIAVFPFLLWIIIDNKKLPVIGDGWKAFRIGSISMALFGSILIALLSQTPSFTSMLSPSVFPTSLKIEMFQTIYPAYFWFLLGLALFSITIYEKFHKQYKSHYPDLLLYVLCGFILYFLPFGITYRLEFYVRVFLAIAISGIGLLLDRRFFTKIRIRIWHKRLLNREVSLRKIVPLFLLSITIVQMYGMFTQYNPYAYISKDEYDAAEWIKNNVPSTAYILTDPSSGYVIRGLTLRNASTYFILPDGRMPADSSTLYPGLDSKIRVFLSSQTGSEWAGIRDWLRFDQIYMVVTTRTVFWTLSTSDSAITQPIDGVDLLSVTSKFREPYFHEMYASNTVAILKYD